MKTLGSEHFAVQLHRSLDLPMDKAVDALEIVLSGIREAVAKGQKVELRGFGAFLRVPGTVVFLPATRMQVAVRNGACA